uniref:Amiloride-sensitive sodium channel n=1 Tax=Globodera pallida TaxID=36090 RepID=A0A183CKD5_GLOPA
HYSESATWSECKLEKNGLFKLEKGCKNLQICYKSELAGKLATGGTLNSVFHIKPNDFFEAINISKEFGLIETDFVKALHLGAFMKEFDGMEFRILALDLLSSIGQNGTGLCKKTCAFEPTAWHKKHFGTNCMEIVFPVEVPKFMLNVSTFPYGLVCEKHESLYTSGSLPVDEYKDYVNACMQVPTAKCQFHVDVYACYKSSTNWPESSSIAKLCRKHLGVDSSSNVAGFRVQICVHREGQFLVVESFFKLSFSNQTIQRKWKFPITLDAITTSMQTLPIFFIEFGNGQQQSAIREKTGGDPINGSNWKIENDGIGSVLNDIKREKINGTWAKTLHFVPPSTADMEIYFQIANPEFSRLITQSPNVRPSENNPNTTWNTYSPCVVYGDDCEEIRELLKAIEDLESCHDRLPLPDDAFKLPPWKKPPPYSRPFRKRSESLRCHGGDVPCDKKSLHKEYIEARKRCGLAPEERNRRKKRH